MMEALRALAEEAILPEGMDAQSSPRREVSPATRQSLRRGRTPRECRGCRLSRGADRERDADVDEDAQPAEETALRRERARGGRPFDDGRARLWRGLAGRAAPRRSSERSSSRRARGKRGHRARRRARSRIVTWSGSRRATRRRGRECTRRAVMIAWQSAASFGAGDRRASEDSCAPVTVPATLAANITTSHEARVRGGHRGRTDPRPRTAAAAISAALGMSDDEIAGERDVERHPRRRTVEEEVTAASARRS